MATSLMSMLRKNFPDATSANVISENYYMNTGIEVLNYIISGSVKGGINLNGRFSTLFGIEGSSKTTIALNIIGEAQQRYNAQILYIDSESTVTRDRLIQFNVNPDDENFMYVNPNTMEEAFDIIEKVANHKIKEQDDTPMLIVFDSVSATATEEEVNRSASSLEIASQAKTLTRNLRRIRPLLHKLPHTGCILISQARQSMEMFASDTIHPTGGQALKHEAVVAIRVGKLKPNEQGQTVKLSTTKNKIFQPYQAVTIHLDYMKGFTQEAKLESLCELLKTIGLIGQSGAWCYLSDTLKETAIKNNMDIDLDKKFYLKDFAENLKNEKFYNDILDLTDEYIKKNMIFVTNQCKDETITDEESNESTRITTSKSENNTDPAEQMFEDMAKLEENQEEEPKPVKKSTRKKK